MSTVNQSAADNNIYQSLSRMNEMKTRPRYTLLTLEQWKEINQRMREWTQIVIVAALGAKKTLRACANGNSHQMWLSDMVEIATNLCDQYCPASIYTPAEHEEDGGRVIRFETARDYNSHSVFNSIKKQFFEGLFVLFVESVAIAKKHDIEVASGLQSVCLPSEDVAENALCADLLGAIGKLEFQRRILLHTKQFIRHKMHAILDKVQMHAYLSYMDDQLLETDATMPLEERRVYEQLGKEADRLDSKTDSLTPPSHRRSESPVPEPPSSSQIASWKIVHEFDMIVFAYRVENILNEIINKLPSNGRAGWNAIINRHLLSHPTMTNKHPYRIIKRSNSSLF